EATAVVVQRLGVISLRVVNVGDIVKRVADAPFVSRRFEPARGFGVKTDRGLVIALLVLGLRYFEQAPRVGRFRFEPFQTPLIKLGGERVIALFVMDVTDIFERLRGVALFIQLFVNGESALKVFNRLLWLAERGLCEADVDQKARVFGFPAQLFLDRQAFLISLQRLLITLLYEMNDARVHPG